MKKEYVVAISIALAFIVVIVCAVLKSEDVTFESVDGEVKLVFEDATRINTWKNGDNSISFKLDSGVNFYKSYIRNKFNDVRFLDKDNNFTSSVTDKYIFIENGHYFSVSQTDRAVTVSELVCGFYTGETEYYVCLPYNGGLAWAEINTISFDELYGVKSIEDLISFYEKIDSVKYHVDKERSIISVSMYSFGDVIEDGVLIKVTEDGIEVELLEKYR